MIITVCVYKQVDLVTAAGYLCNDGFLPSAIKKRA